MSLHRFVLDISESKDQFKSICDLSPDPREALLNFSKYLKAVAAGEKAGKIDAQLGAVRSVGLVTFTGNPTADETVTIANVVLTAKAEPALDDEFDIGASATENATNLAACINANPDLAGIVTATSDAGVVTLTAVVPGKAGNGLALAEGLTNATVTAFANGADGDSQEIDKS